MHLRPSDIARTCREGLEALDHVLQHRPDHVHDDIAEATRCIVRVRDTLVDSRCSGCEDGPESLRHVNSLLSVLVATEFPLVGTRWERLKRARDQYENVIERLASDAPAEEG